MKHRWRSLGVVVLVLVAINLIARLVVRIISPSDNAEFVIGLTSLGAMAIGAAIAAALWTRRYLVPRVASDLGLVALVVAVIVPLIGPLVSGSGPFTDGPGFFLLQVLVCAVVLGIGLLIGMLIVIAMGADPKSRAWKLQAERVRTSPRQRR